MAQPERISRLFAHAEKLLQENPTYSALEDFFTGVRIALGSPVKTDFGSFNLIDEHQTRQISLRSGINPRIQKRDILLWKSSLVLSGNPAVEVIIMLDSIDLHSQQPVFTDPLTNAIRMLTPSSRAFEEEILKANQEWLQRLWELSAVSYYPNGDESLLRELSLMIFQGNFASREQLAPTVPLAPFQFFSHLNPSVFKNPHISEDVANAPTQPLGQPHTPDDTTTP